MNNVLKIGVFATLLTLIACGPEQQVTEATATEATATEATAEAATATEVEATAEATVE